MTLGFWSFRILLSIGCPNCTCTQLFLAPYYFFVFCCSRRCLSRCRRCSKGSQVPGPSLSQAEHLTWLEAIIMEDITAPSWPYMPGGELWCPQNLNARGLFRFPINQKDTLNKLLRFHEFSLDSYWGIGDKGLFFFFASWNVPVFSLSSWKRECHPFCA